jgi:arabinofuranosyltransferase
MQIYQRDKTTAHIALVSLTLATILRTAWISDDAVDTLRSAVNFVHGGGPVVHASERLRGFIHPLWFLAIAAGTLITGNAFAAALGLSVILSLVAMWLLIARVASDFWSGMLAGAGLVLSKAYVDYSSSGLETPLAHFLLISGVLLGFESFISDPPETTLATGSLILLLSLYLCRPELLLAVIPFGLAVLWRSYRNLRRSAMMMLIAVTPVLCWALFSKIYYQPAIPVRTFAHLEGSLPLTEDVRQGIVYLLDSLSRDPLTLTIVTIGTLLSLQRSLELRALAAGAVLYLAYVVRVGGDSMSGHLLTVPLLASAVIVARSGLSSVGNGSIAMVIAILGAFSLPSTILARADYSDGRVPVHGIRDERGASSSHAGLANFSRGTFRQPDDWTPY